MTEGTRVPDFIVETVSLHEDTVKPNKHKGQI